jgi:uncharacterized protein (TIGR00369 family)
MKIGEFIPLMNEHAPPALRKLGGRVHGFDDTSRTIEMRYSLDESFCHSGGIVQGGFVTGMLDASMAHAVIAIYRRYVVVASLEIKVSFLEIARPGELAAFARPVRMGKSIAFLEAELLDTDGRLLATATSTAKVIDKSPPR